ncbi:PREDICTED: sarcoplasmic calcium-binding protein [Rhagoletis zephyria]|uniref:sarcoplasmic calcium-binding protein n=1 Tax=Rhagoletis zephyria TaxID=28612 RepID=UPI000811AA62|nr:PREDICTED: sarcoplasmic calcium-binding protein [Rhagoletis zephyria]
MAFAIMSRGFLRTSREILDRSMAVGGIAISHCYKDAEINHSTTALVPHRSACTAPPAHAPIALHGGNITPVCNGSYCLLKPRQAKPSLAKRQSSTKKQVYTQASSKRDDESDSDSDSDDEFERKRASAHSKHSERGDSEFWRRKMRTLHRILDVNRDGVISFDDFKLIAKRFTDLGHLTPETSAEFEQVMRQTWEEQFGAIDPYNLITAEQFLVELHHRLNDEQMVKRIGRFLPYLFKAVDYDHTGHLDLEQYKLFFRCMGLSDEDAAISFAVIDKNGDGQLSLKEFLHLGRQFFLTEDDTKISKMFWGPLIDH